MTKTILLIHGAWVTRESWAHFRSYYEERAYHCVAPAWPFVDRSAAQLRDSPNPQLAGLTIGQLVDYFEQQVRALPEPPILIGHSFGGLIVQMLLDRGLGAVGIAIAPGPPRGVLPSPMALWSALPVLLSWFGWRRILTMSFAGFARTFANGLRSSERQAVYDAHIVPAPGRIYFQAALGLGNAVNFANPQRAPLLLIAGAEDRTVTWSMVKATYRQYRKHRQSPARTDIFCFPGKSHWLIAEPGWEVVAAKALDWAEAQLNPDDAWQREQACAT